ncbi:MMPL family transporter [Streptomyces yunnanensis]|uniref:Drug exporter of the RND superfamily n=1 Tax=Streptomyces yunnanensis TaxID=156453 RepID=A0A9X8MPX3_9ACTN|nr:MMPL family transporter [Streptomyces yunnanensis]SHL38474.1 putative drug exporter of the RND superfamily [Streptomyces yunnanensis]
MPRPTSTTTATEDLPPGFRPGSPAGRSRLAALGRLVVRLRVPVLLVVLLAMAAAVPIGGDVTDRLSSGGFTDRAAESTKAETFLTDRFGTGVPNLALLARAPGPVDEPQTATAGRDLTRRLAQEPGVLSVTSYWTVPHDSAAPLKARDGRSALVLLRLGGDEDQVRTTAKRLSPHVTGRQGVLQVSATGFAQVAVEVQQRSQQDLFRAEAYAAPVILLILLFVFGSAAAAVLPLLIGVFSILGTFVVLRVLSELTSVSIFATNITTALGLGLAIDYSLFIVTRYREELARGLGTTEAVAQSVRTAGRTVLFSALTVALSLSALMVFPLYFLRSFAYAGVAVVTLAAFAALVVLPAALGLLGPRIDALDVRRLFRRGPRPGGDQGTGAAPAAKNGAFWHRLASAVMRRPVLCAIAVVAVLVVLGLPFTRVSFGMVDDRVLPADAPAHRTAQFVREEFASRESSALSVVLPTVGDSSGDRGRVAVYATRLSGLPGVARVDTVTGSYVAGRQVALPSAASAAFGAGGASWLSVVPSVEPYSSAGTALVDRLRTGRAPGPVLVGGDAAVLQDTRGTLVSRLPVAMLIIGATTMVLLFLFTGSVLIPVKAVLLNVLSLSATFGAMVYVFQEGHLRALVGGFTVTGSVEITMPVLMFCVAFGLSMDYEVFLLSRIKEVYAETGDNTLAVAIGLERTGRLVSAAAALVAVVMIALATSGITFLKLLGVGLALAVLLDATLVRGILVPAVMRLAGRANWWAPPPLRRLHDRLGLSEE